MRLSTEDTLVVVRKIAEENFAVIGTREWKASTLSSIQQRVGRIAMVRWRARRASSSYRGVGLQFVYVIRTFGKFHCLTVEGYEKVFDLDCNYLWRVDEAGVRISLQSGLAHQKAY